MNKIIIIDTRENNGKIVASEDEYGNIEIFKTNEKIINFIKNNPLCVAFPYYIINLDTQEIEDY